MVSFVERVRGAYNAFTDDNNAGPVFRADPLSPVSFGGYISSSRPDRVRRSVANERSIISSVYTRMSIDVSAVLLRHTKHDDSDRYLNDVQSGLQECLTVEANLDQAARAFRQDIVLTIFDKGVAAVVPVDTTINPTLSGGYDIKTMRVGEITQWYPNHVRVSLYNERKGLRQEIVLEKRSVAIIENPLYSVMNEPNSTLQRLIRKLAMLDSVDEASSSGKLDLIVQLPYVVRSDTKREQAEQRRKDIEVQLRGSKYGIAYTDGQEKITQLNRPTENNLLGQITMLTDLLYTQLGITPEVMNGTANEAAMLNYNNRTVEPIIQSIAEAMKRVFLTKTARSQGQTVDYFIDPFKLIPMANIAEISDKLTRNEILTANEVRQIIGFKPSADPKADQLINSNLVASTTGVAIPGADTTDPNAPAGPPAVPDNVGPADTSAFDSVDTAMSAAFSQFGAAPPDNTPTAPPDGDLDPDVLLASLDDLDKSIDDIFGPLEADNGGA